MAPPEHEQHRVPNPESDQLSRDSTPLRDALARLESAVGSIHDSDTFRRYLDAQVRFHHYSWGNVLLILAQRPEATRVAGYRTWQAVGRQVRRGETGIRILAPIWIPDADDARSGDTLTASAALVELPPAHRRLLFRCASVFDVSQTEGASLPAVEVPILVGAEGRELFGHLERVAAKEELTLERTAALPGPDTLGAYDPAHQRILLRESAPLQMAKTLAHELAHHFDRATCSSPHSETIAEAVAYVVCARYGLDTGTRSFPYIAIWSRQQETLKAALGRIQALSSLLIADVEAVGNEDPAAQKEA